MYSLVAGETLHQSRNQEAKKSHFWFYKIFKCDIIENDTIWYRNDIEIKSKKKERKKVNKQ